MDMNAFAERLYDNAREKGFYEHEDWLRRQASDAGTAVEYSDNNGTFKNLRDHLQTALAEHYGNRLILIIGEANEAHDELRAGHGVGELYFSDANGTTTNPTNEDGVLLKPEGVLAELADVAIRVLETMAGILKNLDYDEATKLRGQVPRSEHTEYTNGDTATEPVNVGEILNLKHQFNMSRAIKHGGKAF